MAKIICSEIDEAPALATYAFLPIVQAFCKGTGVDVETKDISLSGRVIANFPENLTAEQKIPDYLAELGEIVLTPEANVIKTELEAAVREGEPPTPRLVADWRERLEDMLWVLINSPEFVFLP